MYLALLLDESSEYVVRRSVPDAGELHLTVIFSSERDREPPGGIVEQYWNLVLSCGGIIELTSRIVQFGPETAQVWALELAHRNSQGADLEALRRVAEEALDKHHISWSKQWGFAPHVTLVKTPTVTLHAPLPKMVRFDRFEWRK